MGLINAKSFRRAAISACAASVLISFGAIAADDTKGLREEIDALKKEIQELRSQMKRGPEEPASKREVTALQKELQQVKDASKGPRDKIVTIGGVEVTIYGTLNADLGTVERTGATAGTTALNSLVGAPGATPTNVPQRYTLRSNSSNLGFRGRKDLAGGISAIFQIESAIGVDGGANVLAGRDTFLGLSSGFGTVLYAGNTDSPYKRGVQSKDPFYATGVATQKGILGSPGFNVVSVGALPGITIGGNTTAAQQQNAGFDIRLNNQVAYRSPIFKGFSAEFAYGVNEQKSTSPGNGIDPSVLSAQIRYEMGPIFASYAYERHDDAFGLNAMTALVPGTGGSGAAFTPPSGASSKDTGNKLGLGYRFFTTTDLLLVWERLEYETNIGAVSRYERDAWVASVSHRWGRHRAMGSYSKADAGRCALASGFSCSTRALGAAQWALGYDFTLDRTTNLYVFWTKIINDDAAAYNFGVSGAPAAGIGADPQALALGIRYSF